MYGSISQPNTIIKDIKHLPAGNFIQIYNYGKIMVKIILGSRKKHNRIKKKLEEYN